MSYMKLTKISRKKIGIIQLEQSIHLLLKQNYICSITLASAAEEFFGQIARKHGKRPIVEYNAAYIGAMYDYLKKNKPSLKEIIRKQNKIRNELKHNDLGLNNFITADFHMYAEQMIVRAIKNYYNAFRSMPKIRIPRSILTNNQIRKIKTNSFFRKN
jgi:hypothetical protein